MGFGRIFGKIAKAVARPEAIEVAKMVLPHVPIPGAAFAAALLRVGQAEKIFTEPGSGPGKKMPWARHQFEKDLRKLGFEEKRANAILELALLALKGEALVKELRGKGKKKDAESTESSG